MVIINKSKLKIIIKYDKNEWIKIKMALIRHKKEGSKDKNIKFVNKSIQKTL